MHRIFRAGRRSRRRGRRRNGNRPQRRGALALEHLERRDLLSVDFFQEDDTLLVIGDQKNDQIRIVGDEDGLHVDVSPGRAVGRGRGNGHGNGPGAKSNVLTFQDVQTLVIRTNGGNDVIDLRIADYGGLDGGVPRLRSVEFDAGEGNDRVAIETLEIAHEGIVFHALAIQGHLGDGVDSFVSTTSGGSVDLELTGEGKRNSVDVFHVSGDADSTLHSRIDLGEGHDNVAVGAQGPLSEVLIGLHVGSGNDRVNLSLHDAHIGSSTIQVDGGAGDNSLTLDSANVHLGSGAHRWSITTEDGDDRVQFNPTDFRLDRSVAWVASIDTGAGNDTLRTHQDEIDLGEESEVQFLWNTGQGDDTIVGLRTNFGSGENTNYLWQLRDETGHNEFAMEIDGLAPGPGSTFDYDWTFGGNTEMMLRFSDINVAAGAAWNWNTDLLGDGPYEPRGSRDQFPTITMDIGNVTQAAFSNMHWDFSATNLSPHAKHEVSGVVSDVTLDRGATWTWLSNVDYSRTEPEIWSIRDVDAGADSIVDWDWSTTNDLKVSSADVSIGPNATWNWDVEILENGAGESKLDIDAAGVSTDGGSNLNWRFNGSRLDDIMNVNVSDVHVAPDTASIRFEIDAKEGNDLIAYELTHVVQGGPGPPEDGRQPAENEFAPLKPAEFIVHGGADDDTVRGSLLDVFVDLDAQVHLGDGNNVVDINADNALADLVTGAGPNVRVFDGVMGREVDQFSADTPQFTDGAVVATGDFNGDGFADIVTGAGAGGGPHLAVHDGESGEQLASFFAFNTQYTGGVNVAVGDINNDGFDDIIVGAATGLAHVRVIDGTKLDQHTPDGVIAPSAQLANFFAFNLGYTGGVTVAAGDVNGDGRADIIAGAVTGLAHVRVIDGTQIDQVGSAGVIAPTAQLANFFAFDLAYTGGVTVAAGDINADGSNDVIVGAAVGLAHVRVIDGSQIRAVTPNGVIESSALLADFHAFSSSYTGGINVAAGDVNGDERADIIVGAATGLAHVRAIDATQLDQVGSDGVITPSAQLANFFAFTPTYTGGVHVAVGDVNGDGRVDVITGAACGVAHVRVVDGTQLDQITPDGVIAPSARLADFFAYTTGFRGGVRVAAGDVNNDGFAEVLTGAGPGGGPHVTLLDGESGEQLASFFAFSTQYTGGVNVAMGDVNNDGVDDVIVAAATGLARVRVIDGTRLDQLTSNGEIASSALLADFYAFTPSYTGGVTVAAGDVNGDGSDDIILGAATGLAHVRVIDGSQIDRASRNGEVASSALLADFFAFTLAYTGGVNVAVGDVNGDGYDDVTVGAASDLAHVRVIDGTQLDQAGTDGVIASSSLLANFFAFNLGYSGGITVAAGDVNGDGLADVVVGAATGLAHVRVVDSSRLGDVGGGGRLDSTLLIQDFLAEDPSFTGGVFVAAADVTGPRETPRMRLGLTAGDGDDIANLSLGGTQAASRQARQVTIVQDLVVDADIGNGDNILAIDAVMGVDPEPFIPGNASFDIVSGNGDDDVEVNYHLFKPDGTPLRAKVSLALETNGGNDNIDADLRVKGERIEHVIDISSGGDDDTISVEAALIDGGGKSDTRFRADPGSGDDEVLVEFAHGDIRMPYVIGSLWNGKDAPPDAGSDALGRRGVAPSLSFELRTDGDRGSLSYELQGKTGPDIVRTRIRGELPPGFLLEQHDVVIDLNEGNDALRYTLDLLTLDEPGTQPMIQSASNVLIGGGGRDQIFANLLLRSDLEGDLLLSLWGDERGDRDTEDVLDIHVRRDDSVRDLVLRLLTNGEPL